MVRMLVGFVYVCFGVGRLFDAGLFEISFVDRVAFWETAVAPWYAWAWTIISAHPLRWAAFFGAVELFIGLSLLLGLAMRPACLVGMFYQLHLFALSWYPNDQPFTVAQFFELHLEQIALFCVILLLGAGRAGRTWGLGALYRHRFRLTPRPVQYHSFEEPQPEPTAPEESETEAEVSDH